VFIFQILGAVILPILASNNVQISDLTSWSAVFDLIKNTVSNPYMLLTVLWTAYCALTDPSTTGISDSKNVLKYEKPRKGDK
jgi:phi LC3 family holin